MTRVANTKRGINASTTTGTSFPIKHVAFQTSNHDVEYPHSEFSTHTPIKTNATTMSSSIDTVTTVTTRTVVTREKGILPLKRRCHRKDSLEDAKVAAREAVDQLLERLALDVTGKNNCGSPLCSEKYLNYQMAKSQARQKSLSNYTFPTTNETPTTVTDTGRIMRSDSSDQIDRKYARSQLKGLLHAKITKKIKEVTLQSIENVNQKKEKEEDDSSFSLTIETQSQHQDTISTNRSTSIKNKSANMTQRESKQSEKIKPHRKIKPRITPDTTFDTLHGMDHIRKSPITIEPSREKILVNKENEKLALEQAQQMLALNTIWICGVCGTPFTNWDSADHHEWACLVKWIDTTFSVADDDASNNSTSHCLDQAPRFGTFCIGNQQMLTRCPSSSSLNSQTRHQWNTNVGSDQSERRRKLTLESTNSQCEDDDIRLYDNVVKNYSASSTHSNFLPAKRQSNNRMAAATVKSTKPLLYVPPRTGGEIHIVSPIVQKYILLTDDTVVKVVQRSKHVLHKLCQEQLLPIFPASDTPVSTLSGIGSHYPEEGVTTSLSSSVQLLRQELEAQRQLALLSRDRHYYGMIRQRSLEKLYGPSLNWHPSNPYRYYYDQQYAYLGLVDLENSHHIAGSVVEEDAKKLSLPARIWDVVKNRFQHAHKLIKEGPRTNIDGIDQYYHDRKEQPKNVDRITSEKKNAIGEIIHGKHTLYVNVVVKNSAQVVNNELQRMARGWWESEINKDGRGDVSASFTSSNTNGPNHMNRRKGKVTMLDFQFEWIRAHTQKRVVQLAGLALASDFTPRRVAVQLSNDLFRLLGPQLQLRGVMTQTVIEYRSGQYFVLAVNILHIDWILLMDHTTKHIARRRRKWIKEQGMKQLLKSSREMASVTDPGANRVLATKKKKKSWHKLLIPFMRHFPSRNEVVAQFLVLMARFHFIISLPLLHILYNLFFKYAVDKYILTVVTDDIFKYVEKKGMEMELQIKANNAQASFMLAALREMRDNDKKRKKKEDEESEGKDSMPILGPLMGSLIKADSTEAKAPENFTSPESLEFVGLELDLPVGFFRLRWALLHESSNFLKDAFMKDVMKYESITMGKWSVHEKEIGLPKIPETIDESVFLNATLEFSYLMPKSAFVKANMCHATHEIVQYNSYCFVIKEKTLTPEVPYGNTFVAWTQYAIVNTGKNTCRMVCSVEAEFPNGPPMVARQIKSGMRSGTAEKFVLLGETICRYAEAVP